MSRNVAQLEAIIRINFNNADLGAEALTVGFPDCNDRLAIVGDSLLKTILSTQWYGTGASKGRFTAAEQRLVTNENLYQVGLEHNIWACVINHPFNPAPRSRRTMATTIEAIIGAAFLDGGLPAAETVMTNLGLTYNLGNLELIAWGSPGADPRGNSPEDLRMRSFSDYSLRPQLQVSRRIPLRVRARTPPCHGVACATWMSTNPLTPVEWILIDHFRSKKNRTVPGPWTMGDVGQVGGYITVTQVADRRMQNGQIGGYTIVTQESAPNSQGGQVEGYIIVNEYALRGFMFSVAL